MFDRPDLRRDSSADDQRQASCHTTHNVFVLLLFLFRDSWARVNPATRKVVSYSEITRERTAYSADLSRLIVVSEFFVSLTRLNGVECVMVDVAYYSQREQDERAMAETAKTPEIAAIHLALAEKYAELVQAYTQPEQERRRA